MRFSLAALLLVAMAGWLPPVGASASLTDGATWAIHASAGVETSASRDQIGTRQRGSRACPFKGKNRKKRCRDRRELDARRAKRGKTRRAPLSIGGGFGLRAPWEAGKTMLIGQPCGSYIHQGKHYNYGGKWGDDSYALDIGDAGCSGNDFGTPILAAHDGRVAAVGTRGYGNNIVIEAAPGGLATRYAHLNTIEVRQGQVVNAGQRIGTLGHNGTGARSNSHLHFVVYANDKPRSGILPSSFDDQTVCNGCRVTSRNNGAAVRATLDAQFPADRFGNVTVAAGQSVPFGFNIRWSKGFNAQDFVLRPQTAQNIANFISVKGVFPGSIAPNDSSVGYYRGTITVPPATAPGVYHVHWIAANGTTPAGLEPSFNIVVPQRPTCQATMDAAFPLNAQGEVHGYPGDSIPIGFNVRFSEAFKSSFVMRPDTVESVSRFVTDNGDITGAVAPNDNRVGYYRTSVEIPADAEPGRHSVAWTVLDRAANCVTQLRPSFVLVIDSSAPGNSAPTASFIADPSTPSVGQVVTFTSTSNDPDGSIASSAWDLDNDGQYDDGADSVVTSSFATAGTHTVRLRVRDEMGAEGTTAVDIAVSGTSNAAPTADFTISPPSPQVGETTTLTATSTDPDGSIASHTWDLDNDGEFDDASGTTATKSFGATGTYTVKLRSVDNGGLSSDASKSITVQPAPPAPCAPNIGTDPGPKPASDTFKATLDAQFPANSEGKVFVARGSSVDLGYNIRYNQTFNSANFVLRPDTPGHVDHFISVKGDWPGTIAPNDNRVGYYRAAISVPACTPVGQYQLKWKVINKANGDWGGLQPSFVLVVQ